MLDKQRENPKRKLPEFKPLHETIKPVIFEVEFNGRKRNLVLEVAKAGEAVIIESGITEPLFYEIKFKEIEKILNKVLIELTLVEIEVIPVEPKEVIFKFEIGHLQEILRRIKNNYSSILKEFCLEFLNMLYNCFKYYEIMPTQAKQHLTVFLNLFEEYGIFTEQEIEELKKQFLIKNEEENR